MEINEFKDRIFDILNETKELPIRDIVVEDKNNLMNIYLIDGTGFTIHIENCKML